MGQRGKRAAFMPNKFVFPGGALDAGDGDVDVTGLNRACAARLRDNTPATAPEAFAAAAIRELWEETGQCLGREASWEAAPGWVGFAAKGLAPDATALHYFFRALTPPGVRAALMRGSFWPTPPRLPPTLTISPRAEDELSHLHWVSMRDVRKLDLPFITRLVLAELDKHLPRTDAPEAVPFVRNDDMESQVIWVS